MLRKNLENQRGVTLLEVLAVVIIGILIVVGAFTLYGNAQNKQRENDVMTSLLTLQTNIRDLFYGVNDYGSESLNDVIIRSGGAPSTFVQTSSTGARTLVSPFDSSASVTITGSGSEFKIAIAGIPEGSCVSLASRNGSFLRVEVGGVEVSGAVDASGQCNGNNNTVTYVSN
jgi:type II secretory pathway pseudopilin PulG